MKIRALKIEVIKSLKYIMLFFILGPDAYTGDVGQIISDKDKKWLRGSNDQVKFKVPSDNHVLPYMDDATLSTLFSQL